MGWRWWDISKSGALTSVNGVIWEPNEPIRSECLANQWGTHSKHDRIAVMPDGRRRKVSKDVELGERRNGLRVIEEPAPAYDCHCGFWAYHDPDSAFGLPLSHNNIYLRTTKVFGVFEAWGDIVHHELGFRCEIAQVRAVVVQRGRLHPCYEIPRYRNLDEIVERWDVMPIDTDAE